MATSLQPYQSLVFKGVSLSMSPVVYNCYIHIVTVSHLFVCLSLLLRREEFQYPSLDNVPSKCALHSVCLRIFPIRDSKTKAAFLWVAWLRGCVPTLEQPRGSKLIIHPVLQAFATFLQELQPMRSFGDLVGNEDL